MERRGISAARISASRPPSSSSHWPTNWRWNSRRQSPTPAGLDAPWSGPRTSRGRVGQAALAGRLAALQDSRAGDRRHPQGSAGCQVGMDRLRHDREHRCRPGCRASSRPLSPSVTAIGSSMSQLFARRLATFCHTRPSGFWLAWGICRRLSGPTKWRTPASTCSPLSRLPAVNESKRFHFSCRNAVCFGAK